MARSQHLSGGDDARPPRRLKILLIDDNESDASLIKEAFSALRLNHDLRIVHDSEEAVRFLITADAGLLPSIILMDLHMPKTDGFEVLTAIRTNPNLETIPVIMWSSSEDAEDVHRAYECGVNAFVRKPMRDFVDLIGDLDRFWFRRVELPVRRA